MNRRDFIKSIIAGTAVLAVPAWASLLAEQDYPHFKPKDTYGNWGTFDSQTEAEKAIKFLDDNMKSVIPPAYRHKVKYIYHPIATSGTGDMLCEVASCAWKYTP